MKSACSHAFYRWNSRQQEKLREMKLLRYPTGHTVGTVHVSLMCVWERGRESHAVRKDCTPGTVPNSCQGCTRVSVTSICFTSLLINWNAAPEIELGTSINCSIVPAGQCSENSTRHSCHFPVLPIHGVRGGGHSTHFTFLAFQFVRWGFLLYNNLLWGYLQGGFSQVCVFLCSIDKQR